MDKQKRQRLIQKGWRFGDAAEFLDLTPEEAQLIELKLALSHGLRTERTNQGLTQVDLADLLGTSQSRVAKMEGGDPSVSVDLLLKALVQLGLTNTQLSKIIATSGR